MNDFEIAPTIGKLIGARASRVDIERTIAPRFKDTGTPLWTARYR
jgi:hypothetical protein